MIKIVSYIINNEKFIFFIVESFKLLCEEKNDFYLKHNNNLPPELEERKIKSVAKLFELEGIYYSLDNHNIFKRKDRFNPKIKLIIMFVVLVSFNLFELIFNIISLKIKNKKEEFSDPRIFFTTFVSLLNILVTLILSTITTTKLKIKTTIFY